MAPSPDIQQAYQHVWPELRTPLAGSTWPEWAWQLRQAPSGAAFTPPPVRLALQGVNRAASY